MALKQWEFPIKYFEDNLIFNKNGGVWACYKVDGFEYDFKSNEGKIQTLNQLSRFVANVGKQAKIYVIPVTENVGEHMWKLSEKLKDSDDMKPFATEFYKDTAEYYDRLYENGSNDFEIFLMVKLEKPKVDFTVSEIIKSPYEQLVAWATADEKSIAQSEINAFLKASDRYLNSQRRRVSIQPTNPEITQWLIKRMFYRGENYVPLRTDNEGDIWQPKSQIVDGKKEPLESDILTLCEEKVSHEGKYIKITHQDGTENYQTFMAVSHIRDRLIFPGSEWLMILQEQSFTAEVCIEINSIEYQKALKKINRNRAEVKGQIRHVAENDDDIPEELFESKRDSEDLKDEIKLYSDPLLEVSIFICVANKNKGQLDKDVSGLLQWYADKEFKIERPFTDQMTLFYAFIPTTTKMVKDYLHRLSPKAVSGSMFAAKRKLGDGIGFPIGQSETGQIVYLDMAQGPALNRSGSALACGTLGGGKSHNMNFLLYLNSIAGGRALIIDPKGERTRWQEFMPEMDINITTLSNTEEDRGKLDPFVIYKGQPSEASELALNMLCELYAIRTGDDEYTLISEIIEKTLKHKTPSMLVLLALLTKVPKTDDLYICAQRLARRMKATMKNSMASLIFGRGTERGLAFNKRVNILQIQNILMPEQGKPKNEYTFPELLSTVLMLPITSFAKKFAMSDNSIFKTVLLDESWVLFTTQMGKSMYSFLARMGRSLNSAAIFIGHTVKDIDDAGLKAAITYKFIFRTPETEEAERALRFLDTEVSKENITLLKNLAAGECLFQDLRGNVGILQFDLMFDRLLQAFDTNPTRTGSKGDTNESN